METKETLSRLTEKILTAPHEKFIAFPLWCTKALNLNLGLQQCAVRLSEDKKNTAISQEVG